MFLVVVVQSWIVISSSRWSSAGSSRSRARARGDGGQTTAEYALVMIGAAALALLLIAWATRTDRVGKLFDFVMEHITGSVR